MNYFKINPFERSNAEERQTLFHSIDETSTGQTNSTFPPHEKDIQSEPADPCDVPQINNSNFQRFQAISLAILSGIAFTYCALTVHLLNTISPPEILLFRTGEQTLLIGLVVSWRLYLRRNGEQEESSSWRLIVGQGTIMAASLQLLFIAFQRLPLGDASALVFSAPAHVSILAWVMLGERPTIPRSLAVLGIVGGGVLVCQTTGDVHKPTGAKGGKENLDWGGLAAAIVGTFGYSLHFVLIRRLRQVHFSLTTFSLSAQTFVLSAIILVSFETFKIPVGGLEWGLLSSVGVVGTAGHVFLAMALSMEEAAVIASTRSLDIAVAYVVQVLICHEPITAIGIGGAALISLCVTFMSMEPYILPKINAIVENVKNLILNIN